MKLYATVSSERASKGQGGNKQVLTVMTAEIDGQRQEICSMSAVLYKNDVIGDYYNVEIITPTHKVITEKIALKTKAEKEKGDNECKKYGCSANGHKCVPF